MMAAIHDHWGQNMQKAQNQHIPKLIHTDWNAKQNRIVSCNTMNKSVCFCEKINSAAENHPILSSMHATLFISFHCFFLVQCFTVFCGKAFVSKKSRWHLNCKSGSCLFFLVCNRNHPKNGGGHRATFKS